MRQMMFYKSHARFSISEPLPKWFDAALLVPHAQKIDASGENVLVSKWQAAAGKAFQVMPKARTCRGPAKTHFVQFIGANPGKVQASLNSQSWKTRIVLYPADALFGDRKEQLAIAHNACGRIMLPVVS
jgi:hypothetical protein